MIVDIKCGTVVVELWKDFVRYVATHVSVKIPEEGRKFKSLKYLFNTLT